MMFCKHSIYDDQPRTDRHRSTRTYNDVEFDIHSKRHILTHTLRIVLLRIIHSHWYFVSLSLLNYRTLVDLFITKHAPCHGISQNSYRWEGLKNKSPTKRDSHPKPKIRVIKKKKSPNMHEGIQYSIISILSIFHHLREVNTLGS